MGQVLGKEFEIVVSRFNRMRRKRHDFIYDSINHVTIQEVETSIDTAKHLIDKIIGHIKRENPQMDLL